MDHEIVLRTVEASSTAVVAHETTWQDSPRVGGGLLDEVYAFARGGGTTQTGHNVVLYRDDAPNVEVGIQVDGPFAASGRVTPSELSAGQVVSTVHRGPQRHGDRGRLARHSPFLSHFAAKTAARRLKNWRRRGMASISRSHSRNRYRGRRGRPIPQDGQR